MGDRPPLLRTPSPRSDTAPGFFSRSFWYAGCEPSDSATVSGRLRSTSSRAPSADELWDQIDREAALFAHAADSARSGPVEDPLARHCGRRRVACERRSRCGRRPGTAPSYSPAARPASRHAVRRRDRSAPSSAFSRKQGARCRTAPTEPGDPQSSRAGLRASRSPGALCAETAHALVGVLAASPLTVGSKRKSVALRADFSFVARAALSARLPSPHDPAATTGQGCPCRSERRAEQPERRATCSSPLARLAASSAAKRRER